MDQPAIFLALADRLIPAFAQMPRFSDVCSYVDALAALDFRDDLKDAFQRGLGAAADGDAAAMLDKLDSDDGEAFNALSTIAITTYYMNPTVRTLIGYPGQESLTYDSTATQIYLTDGSLGKVVAMGRRYRPTPDL